MSEPVIELRGVAKRFGKREILHDVNLSVAEGETFAFLGRNGAGKTTTIRMLLGLIKPDAGMVRVLGIDPGRGSDAKEIRRRVGYLAEDQAMFGWMTVTQILRFMAPFYPTWDKAWADHCAQRFELPLKTKVKHLSKGQSVRLGLLLALAHRPKLVILDDPTLGLDPIMRKEFLRDVVTTFDTEDMTIFFSSHLLYEVEPVADSVAILNGGKIVRYSPTEALRDQVKQLILSEGDFRKLGNIPGLLDIKRSGEHVALVVENADHAVQAIRQAGVLAEPKRVDLNLDEIFEAYVIGRKEGADAAQPDLERVA